MTDTIMLPQLPAPLVWELAPQSWDGPTNGMLTMAAGPRTDLFISPQGEPPSLNAPRLLAPMSGDFQLSARVSVDFGATFDAGTLLVWANEQTWGKLCFEFSPRRQPMVVSVVTRGMSDDANGFTVEGNQVWLRVARLGPALAFHASTDGQVWELIRHFGLDLGDTPRVGFVVQSPTGETCTARFDDIRYSAERLGDLRSGE